MNEQWKNFLLTKSAIFENGLLSRFEQPTAALEESFITDLSRYAVLEISGADAESFLQAQLSSNVSSLNTGDWQRSAWCNIKGRVIATFLLYRADNYFYLLLEHELCEKISNRLQMFVLRSAVTIKDRSGELVRLGLGAAQDTLERLDGSEFELLPVTGNPGRAIILCLPETAIKLWQSMASTLGAVSPREWALRDIQSGLPWIGADRSEEFLPQSLNLDLLGGLSFDKGCYPGQEIVARMHFRGKLKQRLFLARTATSKDIAPGERIYTASTQQHVGQLVNLCEQDTGQYDMLITLDLAAAAENDLHFFDETGPALELLEQPYSLDN